MGSSQERYPQNLRDSDETYRTMKCVEIVTANLFKVCNKIYNRMFVLLLRNQMQTIYFLN